MSQEANKWMTETANQLQTNDPKTKEGKTKLVDDGMYRCTFITKKDSTGTIVWIPQGMAERVSPFPNPSPPSDTNWDASALKSILDKVVSGEFAKQIMANSGGVLSSKYLLGVLMSTEQTNGVRRSEIVIAAAVHMVLGGPFGLGGPEFNYQGKSFKLRSLIPAANNNPDSGVTSRGWREFCSIVEDVVLGSGGNEYLFGVAKRWGCTWPKQCLRKFPKQERFPPKDWQGTDAEWEAAPKYVEKKKV
jgi:hypothetical protein